MATSATSPALRALVERLLRPLALATDDAMRRLDLAIEADADDNAAPSAEAGWPAAVAEVPSAVAPPQGSGVTRQDPGVVKGVAADPQGPAVAPGLPVGFAPASAAVLLDDLRGVPAAASVQPPALVVQGDAAPGPDSSSASLPAQDPAAQGQGLSPAASSSVRPPDGAHPVPVVGPAPPSGLRVVAGRPAAADRPDVVPPQAAAAPEPAHEGWTSPAPPHAEAPRARRHGATLPAPVLEPAAGAVGASSLQRAGAASAGESAAPASLAPTTMAVHHPLPLLPAAAAAVPEQAPSLRARAAPSFSPAPEASPAPSPIGPAARAQGLRVRSSVPAASAPGDAGPSPSRALAPAVRVQDVGAGEGTAGPAASWDATAPRPLRLVANRLDRALAPVFSRALDAGPLPAEDDDAEAAAPARISNTFNVKVALGGAAGALDARQVEEALGDWLRASARRQGLLP